MPLDLETRLAMHRDFWAGNHMPVPLVSFRIGDYFFSDKFPPNLPLLVEGTEVTPDMIDVDAFMDTYETMYRQAEETGQSAFFTAEPCTGFPWTEAMLGCPVMGAKVAFVTRHLPMEIADLAGITLDRSNPWFLKYLEFLDKLVALSKGRFPLGQPILRGVTDVVGALIGQAEMACSLMEEPEITADVFLRLADIHLAIVEEQYNHIPDFHGGSAMGFYHLWAPGKSIWYQDDLSALVSPVHYQQFLKAPAERICRNYEYTLVHVHPSSFFLLDGILSVERLKVIQVNKDVGGPSVEEMLPQFRRILNAGKRLVVWGDLTGDEISLLLDALPSHSLFLNIIAPTVEEARRLMEQIEILGARR